jgi:hypothetical protein
MDPQESPIIWPPEGAVSNIHKKRTGARRWAAFSSAPLGALVILVAACGSTTTSTVNPLNTTTAKADITRAYSTVTNFSDGDLAAKTSAIEDGSSLTESFSQALSSALAKSATGARVLDVTMLSGSACTDKGLSSPCATVSYYLLGPQGNPLPGSPSTGQAVYKDGKWLVTKSTGCSLVERFYMAAGRKGFPPGCNDIF